MICCLTKRTNSSTNSFAVRAPLLTIMILLSITTMILLSITTHRTFGAVAPKQKIFATPDEAVAALIKAAKEKDTKPLLEILGPDAKSFVETSDPVNDRESRERFTKAYEDFHALTKSSDTQINLEVGKDRWPFPIPLVKTSAGWIFDTKEGKEEITNRRIGRNELDVIQVCLAYVDAQRSITEEIPTETSCFNTRRNSSAQKESATGCTTKQRPGNHLALWVLWWRRRGRKDTTAQAVNRYRITATITRFSPGREKTRRAALM